MRDQQVKTLTGLYVNNKVYHHHDLTATEIHDITERNKQFAKKLDRLGVPFKIQNGIAHAARSTENRERYNNDVINDTIKNHGGL